MWGSGRQSERSSYQTLAMAPATSTLVSKLKVQLKLSITRLRMVQQKDEAIAKQQRRAMAQLLEQGKIESARIRVENIIRSDINTELLEVLELYCELLLARTGLLESKDCDPGLEEAVKSIIYAALRTEIKELQQVRQLLMEKYGKEFAMVAIDNSDGKVADRVLSKLKVTPPQPELVSLYLKEIARTYGIDWPGDDDGDGLCHGPGEEEEEDDDDDGEGGSGGQKMKEPEAPLVAATGSSTTAKNNDRDRTDKVVGPSAKDEELSRATPPREISPRSPAVSIAPPSPRSDNINPKIKLPLPPELRSITRAVVGGNTTDGKTDPDAKRDPQAHEGRGDVDEEQPGRRSQNKSAAATAGKGKAGSLPESAARAGSRGGGGGGGGAGAGGAAGAPPDKERAKTVVEGKIPDVDELTARFAALKKGWQA